MRDGRLDYLGGGDAAVDSDLYSVRGKWQRDGRYYPADSLPGDHPGDQLRHGPQGYTLGRDSIIGLLQGGRIKELIYGANVLGLIMMGALSASYVKITTPLKISALKGSEVVVQQILDSIAPGLLPLAAVFAIYFYLVKKGRATPPFCCRLSH